MHELAINLMSSPGAGKTAFLETTIKVLQSYAGVAPWFNWPDTKIAKQKAHLDKHPVTTGRHHHHHHHDHSHGGDKHL